MPVNNDNEFHEDELDLEEFFRALWINKSIFIGIISAFSIISIVFSLFLTNIYTATSLLSPSSSTNSSSPLSQYGGLASMAGISLSDPSSGVSKTNIALSLIKSKRLLQRLIDDYNILPDLMAAKSWDKKNNALIYDSSIYNSSKEIWISGLTTPQKSIPSIHQAFKVYEQIVSVSQDNKSGIITLRVQHMSPKVAAQLSKLIVSTVNSIVAEMDIQDYQASISYLEDQLTVTPYAELRTLFYELIQDNTQSMMLAKVKKEYALETIDPPLEAEQRSSPVRSLIVILATFFGAIFSLVVFYVRFYVFNLRGPIQINLPYLK
ncbi:Wzz/FepE/Etk N-terminal domain-containing protein [Gammaproteobacteria bacterium]|nr:Wzz/FepE/Etk N-terminal domain-containing protein [Gammaproteobacteria bacterium]